MRCVYHRIHASSKTRRPPKDKQSKRPLLVPLQKANGGKDKVAGRLKKMCLITSYRSRLLDLDNLMGGAKLPIDVLCEFGWLDDDDPMSLHIEIRQIKCKRVEERTEFIILDFPD